MTRKFYNWNHLNIGKNRPFLKFKSFNHISKKCAELVVLFQIHLITLGNIVSGEIYLKL